jgi:hypothetical protein
MIPQNDDVSMDVDDSPSRGGESHRYDRFRWAEVSPKAIFYSEPSSGVPLKQEHINILASDLDWDEIEWGPCSVRIRGIEYPVQTILFKPTQH